MCNLFTVHLADDTFVLRNCRPIHRTATTVLLVRVGRGGRSFQKIQFKFSLGWLAHPRTESGLSIARGCNSPLSVSSVSQSRNLVLKSVSQANVERPTFGTESRKIPPIVVKRHTNLTSFWQKLSSPTAKEGNWEVSKLYRDIGVLRQGGDGTFPFLERLG